jgi:hypothetical protein
MIVPINIELKTESFTQSSRWKDHRNHPYNPAKTTTSWNAGWGQGQFTCIHTLNDAAGAWWKVNLENTYTIGKIKILNRGDCCGGRLNLAKIYIDD